MDTTETIETIQTIECYRFVEDDLTSANGDVSWRIGEWQRTSGPIRCCSNGLHAAPTPRDSLRHVYGRRWFLAEARGGISRQTHKFAASEMRLVEEIPAAVLRRFAVRCAQDALDRLERRHPLDARVRQCLRATEDFLDGGLGEGDLIEGRRAAGGAIAAGAPAGADTGRAVAATIAASYAADGDAGSWTAAAAAAAYAAHAAADAVEAAEALIAVYAAVHNVAAGIEAAHTADRAATAAHTAAAAGAAAHAAAVAAARGTYAADTAADPYYAAFSEFSAHPTDTHYLAQNATLVELIGEARAARV
ncbi:hypothetical protein OG223_29795 [Streptomyces sp. NBC_01478]|uniref:DUF7666 domain-containing protein n=1 Tax=Streptomyces sp. NBC_01478 TaxID=2903882 RepID=UPI002E2FC1C5|nr:hypothetical protein [Streptomyces sp. NBC_01478]